MHSVKKKIISAKNTSVERKKKSLYDCLMQQYIYITAHIYISLFNKTRVLNTLFTAQRLLTYMTVLLFNKKLKALTAFPYINISKKK